MENSQSTPNQINPPVFTPGLPPHRTGVLSSPLNTSTLKDFFRVTGGSSLYCLSAVLVAYGIIRVLAPVLESSNSLRDALPALLTLHVYELALLGVLLLLVFRKVVDDAISLAILIILFLVGTSIAFGSVSDRAIKASVYIGLVGVLLAFVKFYVIKRIARIPLGFVTMLGFVALMAYNYLGPVIVAHSVAAHPADEIIRRDVWLWVYMAMLTAGAVVWITAARSRPAPSRNVPFFNSHAMAILLGIILVACSGVHQYTMAYAFTLQRVLLDYVPVIAIICLLLMELFRSFRRQSPVREAAVACVPLAMTLLAIYHKSVLSSGDFGIGLIAYPPFMLSLIALALAAMAFHQKRTVLWIPVYGYVLAVVLTAGFSPEYPHRLNTFSFGSVLILSLLLVGLLRWNPYICLAGIMIGGLALPSLDRYAGVMKNWQLTEFGGVVGIFGIGIIGLYLLFTAKLHKFLRVGGAACLAAFIFDYLPAAVHWRYVTAVVSVALIALLLWWRTKDWIIISLLTLPFVARGYILAKQLAFWRHVIVGFALLAAGAIVSLFKHPRTADAVQTNPSDIPESAIKS